MRIFYLFVLIFLISCQPKNSNAIIDLPIDLAEVSGIAFNKSQNFFWMVNDSGNKPILYAVDMNGTIIKELKIKGKNRDWEDLTTDTDGNLYIGNFGNNSNDSKDLSILKISAKDLQSDKKIKPKKITFSYPEQEKFPPKKHKRHFDCESFFYFKNNLYLFTKSRDPKHKGKTNLYQLPTEKGNYKATYLNTFETCNDDNCWVTSADINASGTKVALLMEGGVFVFSDFEGTNFFSGTSKQYTFKDWSQKESVVFKNDSTLYIADEYLGTHGGNVYEFSLN